MKIRVLWAAMAAAVIVAACATQKEEVAATSEVIYEEEAPATPTSPFANCKGQLQQGATILRCDNVVAVYVPVPARMTEAQIEQNFQQFDGSFPKESTRERFTEQIGNYTATGMRVFEESQVAPFRAEMLVVPTAENQTKVLSCAVSGSTDYTRCTKIVTELVTTGVPADIEGLPKPEADAGVEAVADGGMMEGMSTGDAGMTMDAADAGMGTDGGTTTRTRRTKSKP